METLKLINLGYLGSGSNARVQKALFNNQEVAVKIFNKTNDAKSEAEYLKEVNELKKLSHPHIVKLYAFGKWQEKVDVFNCMVIELADVGSLHHVLYETDLSYTLGHAISWLKQCGDAIDYLHSRQPKPTIHRDLKPLNLLLLNGGVLLKVCDFGTACNLKTIMTVNKGSPCWIAPEQLMEENYNEKCDVFSYCIIAWEIIVRQNPYFHLSDPSSAQIMFGVFRGTIRPKNISNCPQILEKLFEQGMNGEPTKRPTMSFVFEIMKFFDALINKEPIKPIIVKSENDLPTNINSSENKLSHGYGSVDSIQSTKSTTSTVIRTESIQIHQNTNDQSDLIRNGPGRLSFNTNSQTSSLATASSSNGKFHRRSKSYGSPNLMNLVADKNTINETSLKSELLYQIETMLYDPINPLNNNSESIEIFNKHKELIQEDDKLSKLLIELRQQHDQLEAAKANIKSFKTLTQQKNTLKQENEKLKTMLNECS